VSGKGLAPLLGELRKVREITWTGERFSRMKIEEIGRRVEK
jgi:hypothetical protein